MRFVPLLLAASFALGACTTATTTGGLAANELSVNYEGDTFAGTAGASWSDEDLRSNAFGSICGDRNVASISINRLGNGTAEFTGMCAA